MISAEICIAATGGCHFSINRPISQSINQSISAFLNWKPTFLLSN